MDRIKSTLGTIAVGALVTGLFFIQCVAPIIWAGDCPPGYGRTIELGGGDRSRCEANSRHAEVIRNAIRDAEDIVEDYNSSILDATTMREVVSALSIVATFYPSKLSALTDLGEPPDNLRAYSIAVEFCCEDLMTGFDAALRRANSEPLSSPARVVTIDIDPTFCNSADAIASGE